MIMAMKHCFIEVLVVYMNYPDTGYAITKPQRQNKPTDTGVVRSIMIFIIEDF